MTSQRRPHGAGSVDVLRSGRFRVRIRFADGTRRTVGVRDTLEAAEALLRGALAELAGAGELSIGAPTVRGYGARYLEHRELHGRNEPTDKSRWHLHVLSAPFADWAVADVKPRDVRAWRDVLLATKAKPKKGQPTGKLLGMGTVRHCLNLLRAFFAWLVEDELVPMNPALGVDIPLATRKKRAATEDPWTYLVPEEIETLLRAVPMPMRALVAVAIGTGMRQGEQWALELVDVHLEGERPHVWVRYGGPNHAPTKSGKPRRVELFGLGLAGMRAWLAALKDGKVVHRKHSNDRHLAFPTLYGNPQRDGKPPRKWDTWLAAAALGRDVRWHDLRHTCASALVCGFWGRRWSLEEVREVMGHVSITTTERYAHLAETVQQTAARETMGTDLGRALGRSETLSMRSAGEKALRATVDSNHWPSAPEAVAVDEENRALATSCGPSAAQAVPVVLLRELQRDAVEVLGLLEAPHRAEPLELELVDEPAV